MDAFNQFRQGVGQGGSDRPTLQPGGTSYEDMRFTGIARPQGGFGLRGDTGPEMFRDQLTNELVTKAQMDSLGGREALLTPSQKSSVAERNQADLFGMQAAQAKLAGGQLSGGSGTGAEIPQLIGGAVGIGPQTPGFLGGGIGSIGGMMGGAGGIATPSISLLSPEVIAQAKARRMSRR